MALGAVFLGIVTAMGFIAFFDPMGFMPTVVSEDRKGGASLEPIIGLFFFGMITIFWALFVFLAVYFFPWRRRRRYQRYLHP